MTQPWLRRSRKLSIAVPRETAAWARKNARELKKSLSAIVTEAIEERRRARASTRFLDERVGDEPLTPRELAAARRELAWKA